MKQTTPKTWIIAAAVAGLTSLAGGTLYASDGAIEINMAAALAGGVTPSDGAGLPVTLDTPGSYILTGNLTTSSTGINVIEMTASDVTLDMNGFSITGPGSGSGNGIFSQQVTTSDNEVRNGTVRAMGSAGVRLAGFRSRVINVRVLDNGDRGIQVGGSSLVKNCLARDNNEQGVSASTASSVIETIAQNNGNATSRLGGIFVGNNGLASNNMATDNFGEGIITGSGATVIGNSASENTEHGIRAGSGALVRDNAVRQNSLFGLSLSSNSAYVGNVMTANGSGSVFGGTQIGTNYCNTSTTCP